MQSQYRGEPAFAHPRVGTLTLRRERMVIDGAHGVVLVTLHPVPGSPDGDRLAALLAEVSASR